MIASSEFSITLLSEINDEKNAKLRTEKNNIVDITRGDAIQILPSL